MPSMSLRAAVSSRKWAAERVSDMAMRFRFSGEGMILRSLTRGEARQWLGGLPKMRWDLRSSVTQWRHPHPVLLQSTTPTRTGSEETWFHLCPSDPPPDDSNSYI